MTIWLVVVGRILPFGWTADEFDLIAVYRSREAAVAHMEAINRVRHALYEHATVEAWDLADEMPTRRVRTPAAHRADVTGERKQIAGAA